MTDQPAENARLLRAATRASVSVSGGLVIAKFFAWWTTGSVSVLASLLDSVMDTATSLINLFAVHFALKPPDDNHRFGHGKAEALAGLIQALAISASACFLLYQAVWQLLEPAPLVNLGQGLWILGIAIVATLGLVAFQRHVIRRTGSTAIRADSLHYQADLLTNSAVLVALFLSNLGWAPADGWIGLGIGLYVLYSAIDVGFTAVRLLMDEELPEGERQQIIDAATRVGEVVELRSWRSGQTAVVQLVLSFPGEVPLNDITRLIEQTEQEIQRIAPGADVTVQPVAAAQSIR